MRVERNFSAFLGLAILLGGFLAAFLVARRLQLRSSTSDPSPLTATIIEERYSPGSTQPSYVEYSLSAVRSDGSWAVISRRQAPDGRWVEMKLVTSLASGTRITVDPTTESLVTFKLSKGAASFFQSQRVACGKVPNPQRSTLLGYDVVELTEPFGPPEGRDTVTRWLAPSLGCFTLNLNGGTRGSMRFPTSQPKGSRAYTKQTGRNTNRLRRGRRAYQRRNTMLKRFEGVEQGLLILPDVVAAPGFPQGKGAEAVIGEL